MRGDAFELQRVDLPPPPQFFISHPPSSSFRMGYGKYAGDSGTPFAALLVAVFNVSSLGASLHTTTTCSLFLIYKIVDS
jgi:hypothetical protein